MPIYEFACDTCRRVVQFFLRSPSSAAPTACPRCGKEGLRRLLSGFAVGGKARRAEEPGSGPEPGPGSEAGAGPDPDRLERALSRLEGEMDSIDEDDPRQMGRFLRRVMEETGTGFGKEMDEAVRRLEAGEDPEKIEEEMEGLLGDEGGGPGAEGGYEHDDHLYEM
jgi:putative FmdB family regulatory protein